MKPYIFLSRALLSAIVAGSVAACTTDFEEINTNPNTMLVGDLNPYGVFEAMFYGYGNTNTRFCYSYSNELVQFTASSSATSNFHRYSFNNSNLESIWSAYGQYAANANHMISQGYKYGDLGAVAVGKTLKALFLSNATDIFGDIPCREAFRVSEGVTTPVLDSQEDVYRQIFDMLEDANELYADGHSFAKPTIDIMYNGNMSLWRKFNNSLYMRLLMRVSARPEMKATEKLGEIVSKPSKYPVIGSNSESATIKNTGIAPYYGTYRTSEMTKTSFCSHLLTNMFIDMCLITGAQTEIDPRLYTMCAPTSADSEWIGVQGGASLSEMREDRDDASSLNYKVLVRDAAPVWILDYSEVQFILAEAALKGYIPGGEAAARQHYETAVKASCEKWAPLAVYSNASYPITEARINAFLEGKLAGWDTHEDKASLIADQKFISLFWIGFEAYHELRRTGRPIIPIGNGCSYNNFEYPQRLPYPTNTVGSNSANVQIALDRMGGDNTMRTPVWWSYKAINGTFTAVRVQKP